jgi:hypothetical protein
MSWLYIPPETLPEPQTHACTAFPSAPEPEGATSGSPSPAPGIALFVTLGTVILHQAGRAHAHRLFDIAIKAMPQRA